MMVKAIAERIEVAVPLCPSVFKFFLGQAPTLHDLEAWDPSLGLWFHHVFSFVLK